MSQHQCKAAIVHCIDFRFQESINNFIDQQKLCGNCDRIGIAGGVKNIDQILEELSISQRLHQITDIYLINHQDCGAYGPAVASNLEKELETHTQDLKQAQKVLLQKFPQIKIHTYFLTMDKEFTEIK